MLNQKSTKCSLFCFTTRSDYIFRSLNLDMYNIKKISDVYWKTGRYSMRKVCDISRTDVLYITCTWWMNGGVEEKSRWWVAKSTGKGTRIYNVWKLIPQISRYFMSIWLGYILCIVCKNHRYYLPAIWHLFHTTTHGRLTCSFSALWDLSSDFVFATKNHIVVTVATLYLISPNTIIGDTVYISDILCIEDTVQQIICQPHQHQLHASTTNAMTLHNALVNPYWAPTSCVTPIEVTAAFTQVSCCGFICPSCAHKLVNDHILILLKIHYQWVSLLGIR